MRILFFRISKSHLSQRPRFSYLHNWRTEHAYAPQHAHKQCLLKNAKVQVIEVIDFVQLYFVVFDIVFNVLCRKKATYRIATAPSTQYSAELIFTAPNRFSRRRV